MISVINGAVTFGMKIYHLAALQQGTPHDFGDTQPKLATKGVESPEKSSSFPSPTSSGFVREFQTGFFMNCFILIFFK
jgi:hypothetical protein